MNSYGFRFILDAKTPKGFVAGDASLAARLCSAVGHLWLGSKQSRTGYDPMWAGTGTFDVTDDTGIQRLDFLTPLRLPSSVELQDVPDITMFNAAKLACGFLDVLDDNYNDRMNNLGNPIVINGALVVALTLGGVDVSSQMTTQLRIPVGADAGGLQYLTIGFAAASAQDGVYQTPFSTALAYWTGGTGGQRNAPVVTTVQSQKQLAR